MPTAYYAPHAASTSSSNAAPRATGAETHERNLRSLDGQDEATILREIQSALRGLRFGAVEITVHNGQVVQIERKEKFRLQQPAVKQA